MIVVFGAGGFIGTYLIDGLIADGYEVLAVDVSEIAETYYRGRGIPFARVDITSEASFAALPTVGVDAIVNVACLQPVNVSEAAYRSVDYIQINVVGVLNILEWARRVGTRDVVHTISHRGVQGLWVRGEIITESSVKALKHSGDYTMFSISECAALDCIEHYNEAYGRRGVVLRLPPVYGYGPHLEGYRNGKPVKTGFMIFIERATKGEPLELWGDPERARDIVYVKDVVTAILLSLRNKEAIGLYNVASGEKVSLRTEAEEIVRVFSPKERPSTFVYRPERPNSVEPFLYDISKARRDLQWYPRYGVREMLEDFKREMESGRFDFLVEKRRQLFARGG